MVSMSLLRLLARDAVGDRDVEELALADRRDAVIAEPVQRRADGLALRIENRGFKETKTRAFMGTPIIAR